MLHKSIITASQFTKSEVIHFISKAQQIKQFGPQCVFPNKTIIQMFFEPSTRTSCSFQCAAIKLQCNVISLSEKMSSAEKGESLEDTIKTIQYYGDAIVLRHPEKGSSIKANAISKIPIINAGDGNGEHPTQALLDIFTMYSELQQRAELDITDDDRPVITITFVGDLKNSRTVHSLINLLCLFPKIKFIYMSPKVLQIPYEIIEKINTLPNCEQVDTMSLDDALKITNVLYMTRIQKERFPTLRDYQTIILQHDYEKNYCITTSTLPVENPNMIIMHPLPRNNEISVDVDHDPRAVYFKQVENGVYMRMALLDYIFSQ